MFEHTPPLFLSNTHILTFRLSLSAHHLTFPPPDPFPLPTHTRTYLKLQIQLCILQLQFSSEHVIILLPCFL